MKTDEIDREGVKRDFMSGVWRLADLRIDMRARTVTRADENLNLGDLSLDFLAVLAAHYPNIVSPEVLTQAVWKRSFVSEEVISQRVALIRRGLGDTARTPRYIRTVRAQGYVLAQAPHLLGEQGQARGVFWRWSVGVLGVLGLMCLSVAGWVSLSRPSPERDQIVDLHAGEPEDYRLVRARDYLNIQQPEATDQAIVLLEDVLTENPDHSAARLRLSFALSTRATKFNAHEGDVERAEYLAQTLIGQRREGGAAWHAYAYALDAQGRIDEAMSAYELAYHMDGEDGAALSSLAYLLQIRGRLAEALTWETQARTSGVGSLYSSLQIANVLRLLGHGDAPIWYRHALELGRDNVTTLVGVAQAYDYAGQRDEGIDLLDQASDAVRQTSRWRIARARLAVAADDKAYARRLLEGEGGLGALEALALEAKMGRLSADDPRWLNLRERAERHDTWPELRVRWAEIAAGMGEMDMALDCLNQAVDLGWRDKEFLRHSPYLGGVWDMEQGADLMARMGRELAMQRDQIALSGLLDQISMSPDLQSERRTENE